ncbi:hypothetical protein D3C73_1525520 [compost metagenome]
MQLLIERVHFNLIHRRGDLIKGNKIGQSVGMEVAHANSTNFTCLLQLFHGTPCAVDIAVRLVNQIQVNIVEL